MGTAIRGEDVFAGGTGGGAAGRVGIGMRMGQPFWPRGVSKKGQPSLA
jgi:hypothetical protein